MDNKLYKSISVNKLESRKDIIHCPKCGEAMLWRKPSNKRKFACSECKTESIIVCPHNPKKVIQGAKDEQ